MAFPLTCASLPLPSDAPPPLPPPGSWGEREEETPWLFPSHVRCCRLHPMIRHHFRLQGPWGERGEEALAPSSPAGRCRRRRCPRR